MGLPFSSNEMIRLSSNLALCFNLNLISGFNKYGIMVSMYYEDQFLEILLCYVHISLKSSPFFSQVFNFDE